MFDRALGIGVAWARLRLSPVVLGGRDAPEARPYMEELDDGDAGAVRHHKWGVCGYSGGEQQEVRVAAGTAD